jgi:hypothetical protein
LEFVSNAIKYGSHRPVEICAEDYGVTSAFGCEITAQAPPVDARSRIFRRFERALGPDERRSGFGVGLWVSVSSLTPWEERSGWTMHREAARYHCDSAAAWGWGLNGLSVLETDGLDGLSTQLRREVTRHNVSVLVLDGKVSAKRLADGEQAFDQVRAWTASGRHRDCVHDVHAHQRWGCGSTP